MSSHTVCAFDSTQEDEDYWPPYGSTIEFAVSKQQAVPLRGVGGEEASDAEDGLVMVIFVDGEPLRSTLFSEGTGGGAGGIPVSGFRRAVQDLLWTKK